MIEAAQIGVSINVLGDPYKKILEFSKSIKSASFEVEKLTRLLKPLNAELKKLSIDSLGGTNQKFETFSRRMLVAEGRANKLAAANMRLSHSLKDVERSAGEAGIVSAAMPALASTAAATAVGRRRHSHLYGHIGRHIPGTHNFIGVGATLGAAGVAGSIAAGLGYQGFKEQKEFQGEAAKLGGAGLTQSQIEEAKKIALAAPTGMSPVTLIKALQESQLATRRWSEAKIIAPIMAKGKLAMKGLFGSDLSATQQMNLLRSAEIRGGSDTKEIAKWLQVALSMHAQAGGLMKTHQQSTFWTTAPQAAARLKPEAYMSLEPIIQELGGGKVGTGYKVLTNQLIAGKGRSKKSEELLKKYGILNAKGEMPETFKKDLAEDLPKFVLNDVVPLLKSHGIKTVDKILEEFTKLFSHTAPGLFASIVKNEEKINRARAIGFSTVDELKQKSKSTPGGAELALHEAWSKLALSIGRLSSPAIIKGMNDLSATFDSLASALDRITKADVMAPINWLKKITGADYFSKIDPFKDKVNTELSKKKPESDINAMFQIYLDGKPIQDGVVKSIVKQATAMPSGQTYFNSRQNLTPPQGSLAGI